MGENNPLYDVEVYNASTNQVETFNARLDRARLNDLAALLPSNTVLLWGGVGADGAPLSGAELYDHLKHGSCLSALAALRPSPPRWKLRCRQHSWQAIPRMATHA